MSKIEYARSEAVPVVHEADVIVIGGGPGGLGAAVMAARAGARTLLIERYGFLGGMATAGEVHPFMPNHARGRSLDGPVYREWLQRMREYLPREWTEDIPWTGEAGPKERMIAKEAAVLAAEEVCLEAGVRLLYHHQVADALRSETRITHLVLLSKSGFTAAAASVYVDATGDADVAARAGCTCEQGGPSGYSQPMTLCFKLSGVDRRRVPSRDEIHRLYAQARARGEICCPRDNILWFDWFDPGVIHFNTTRVLRRHGTSGPDLSEAEVEARRQLRELLAFFRTYVPGFERAGLYSMAHHIGVRETRRVRGLAYLTRADFATARKFPDAIARVSYPIDIHNPVGGDTEHQRIPEGDWYEVPYGCLVARDVDNLLLAGRPISADHAVHSSLRIMPVACSIGQAAGMAAALAAIRRCAPRDLDGREVRQELITRGARLEKAEPAEESRGTSV